MQQQEIVAAFPNPPPFFKLADGVYPEGEKAPPPPPAPPEGVYRMFGLTYTTSDVLPSLEDEGRVQLYPKGEIDHVVELKKLNRSLLFNYLQLLDILVKNPEQYKAKIDNIELLFINIHHLLNGFRPHQGREVLIETMEKQIEKRKKATQDLEQVIEAAQKTLYNTKCKLIANQKKNAAGLMVQTKKERDVEMEENERERGERGERAVSAEDSEKLHKMEDILRNIKNNSML